MNMNQGETDVTPDALATATFTDVTTLGVAVANVSSIQSTLNLGLVLGIAIPLAVLCNSFLI